MSAYIAASGAEALLAALNGWLSAAAHPLANHLWQSTVFAVIAAALALVLKRNQARARYWIWMCASAKFLLPFALLAGLASHWAKPRAVAPIDSAVYSTVEQFDEPFAYAPAPSAPIQHAPTVRPRTSARKYLAAGCGLVWFAGFAAVLTLWTVRWRRVARGMREATPLHEGREIDLLRRMERAAGVRRPIRLLASSSAMEPGIFGIVRPVLAWPAAISARLDDAQLEAVLAHEVCHVRRRDNLTAALHMLVESLFWFHPMVWGIGARLVEERERACDEQVLEVCGHPTAYAESILKVCEYCVQTPLECVSGVTGADLKQRVIEIMSARSVRRLTLMKKLLIATVAACVLAVPFVIGQAQAARRLAAMMIAPPPQRLLPAFLQSAAAPAASVAATPPATLTGMLAIDPTGAANGPAFEVASIRPSRPAGSDGSMGVGVTASGRVPIQRETLEGLVTFAYLPHMGTGLVQGGPDWARTQEFDINAKVDNAEAATWGKLSDGQRLDRIRPMVRTLLAKRFGVTLKSEMRMTQVYALVQAKGGAKLKTVDPPPMNIDPEALAAWLKDGEAGKRALPGAFMLSGGEWSGNAIRIDVLMNEIAGNARVDRLVVDQTGLKGYYDFTFHQSFDKSAPILLDQVEQQLGLKLEPRKLSVQTYTILSAEKPSVDGAEVADSAVKALPIALVQEKAAPDVSAAANTGSAAAAEYVPTMTFDVASVRQAKVDLEQGITVSGGWKPQNSCHLVFQNFDLWNLVTSVYLTDRNQMDGMQKLPEDMRRAYFNIEAKCDPASEERIEKLDKTQRAAEQQHMMRVLLEERFNLKAHWETRDGKTYDLVVSKAGRLHTGSGKPSADELAAWGDHEIPALYQHGSSRTYFTYTAHGATTGDIADMLSSQFGRPVNDKTGLTGKYDFDMQTHDTRNRDRRDDDTSPYPTLEDAIEDQLGLKIVPSTGPVKFLVVDHMDMPTEN